MFHSEEEKSSFILILQQIDQDTANSAKQEPCQHCGGKVHSANYQRKSRGFDESGMPLGLIRYGLCCGVDGCRKRYLPNSVSFFGRCVYLFFFMVLASASIQEKTLSTVAKQMGVSRQTIKRWRCYWQVIFPQTRAWKAIRAMFAISPSLETIPLSILQFLGYDSRSLESMRKSLELFSEFL